MIKTLVVCPLFTRSGYGEHGRFIVNALDSRPDLFDLHVHPIHWGQSSWISTTHPNVARYEELCIKKEVNKENYDLVSMRSENQALLRIPYTNQPLVRIPSENQTSVMIPSETQALPRIPSEK